MAADRNAADGNRSLIPGWEHPLPPLLPLLVIDACVLDISRLMSQLLSLLQQRSFSFFKFTVALPPAATSPESLVFNANNLRKIKGCNENSQN